MTWIKREQFIDLSFGGGLRYQGIIGCSTSNIIVGYGLQDDSIITFCQIDNVKN